ncbi:hypothetical protein INP57_24055 [Saccharopolyspora sp. HNM0986]|uniref:hypothetical protein n=1 Tax=Saccharopolyspora galaxeae TaxID=2781241 RepID=UPI00190C2DBD|nr:hypothetical protein [Saccharopolyspora sp. HNM0986]MBK0869892.1 hypothetical protein [Saccharopolyspora sp. HNM0986]
MTGPEQANPEAWPNSPTAAGNAHVGQMSGVHNGDTAFHYGDTTYHINQDDPPEVKEEVALRHLDGGTPRPAEEVLKGLLRTGHATSKLAYYYALAVFSERSLTEVGESVLQEFDMARKTAAGFGRDGWRDAIDVVQELVHRAWNDDAADSSEPQAKPSWEAQFNALDPRRRNEITRHLGLIVDGVVQEYLEESETDRILHERMQPDRAGRAWKFFEPDPAHPVPFTRGRTLIPAETRLRAWGGAFAALCGLLGLVPSLAGLDGLFAAVVLGCGGYLACRYELICTESAFLIARKDDELAAEVPQGPPQSPGHWVTTKFVEEIHRRVDARFTAHRPHVAGNWATVSRCIRARLTYRLASLHGNRRLDPEQLDWLIDWHARDCSRRWANGTLFGYRTKLAPPRRAVLLRRCGIAASASGLLVLVGAGVVLPAFMVGVGGYFAVVNFVTIVATRRTDAAQEAEDAALFEKELQEHRRWMQVLADRPDDPEMGRWLDLDKAYLKKAALKTCALTVRDLMEYALTIEKMPKARQAAVPGGPPRCDHYAVKIFLLTRGGVRLVEFDFDFLTGKRSGELRNGFRYHALTSATVTEAGVRAASPNRYSVEQGVGDLESVRLRSRALRLSLNNGNDIDVIVNKFNRPRDLGVVSEDDLRARELHVAGVSTTLQILEAVASEGNSWMQREQERRSRIRRRRRDIDFGGLEG